MENPRKIAVDILDKVLKGRFVDDCLASDTRLAELEERDKGFVKAMVNTTLRHYGEIDHFLHQFAKRKNTELYLGVAQLKFMDLPAHAVVNEMVEISERKAFNNAVLRKAAQKDIHRNTKLNIPNWLFGAWKKAYGEEVALQIAENAMSESGYIDLSFKGGATKRVVHNENITKIDGFAEGEFWVQDASQRHAVEILGDVKGLRVLDMCAAPGGKTAQLIDRGAKVTALDSSIKRIERLKENLARLQMSAEIVLVDGREYESGEFDAILLDAPCTATGTLAKNPEILVQRKLEDVKELVRIQNELIASAYKLLKKGGVLAYSTCSLQYEECEGLVKKLKGWELLEEKRVLPFESGGAYVAKLVKL
jgi:16S rRNA (cytosine967-C5)-methyltransferase